jgi:hypothetical protein
MPSDTVYTTNSLTLKNRIINGGGLTVAFNCGLETAQRYMKNLSAL